MPPRKPAAEPEQTFAYKINTVRGRLADVLLDATDPATGGVDIPAAQNAANLLRILEGTTDDV